MEVNDFNKKELNKMIDNASTMAIIPSRDRGIEAYCAAVGLFYMLQEKFEDTNKKISFIYKGAVPEEAKDILEPKHITSELHERELTVSVDYANTRATKVQYSTDDDILRFKLGPLPKDFDIESKIKAKITGFDFDVVFVVGARELEDLGPTYRNLQNELRNSKIINIDNSEHNMRFGISNIVDTSTLNLATVVLNHAPTISLQPNVKAATALLTGIKKSKTLVKVEK